MKFASSDVWQGADPVETVKEAVKEEKLPWIIISEALTVGDEGRKENAVNSLLKIFAKNIMTPQSEFYAIYGVPTIGLSRQSRKNHYDWSMWREITIETGKNFRVRCSARVLHTTPLIPTDGFFNMADVCYKRVPCFGNAGGQAGLIFGIFLS